MQALLLLPLMLVLLWVAFRRIDLADLWQQVCAASYFWVIMGLLLGVVSLMVRTLRWQLMLQTESQTHISYLGTFYALMVGYFANLLIPRAGEVVRCAEVARHEDTRFDVALGTVVAERLSDVLMSLVVLGVSILISLQHFGGFVMERMVRPVMAAWTTRTTIWLIAILLLALLLTVGLVLALRRGAFGQKIRQKALNAWDGLLKGMLTIWTMPRKWEFLLLTLLLWLLYWLNTYVVTLSIAPTEDIGLLMSLPILAVGTFGMVVPVQGGLGSYHLAVALWLQTFGLTRAEGLTYATLAHAPQLLLILVLPALLYPLLRVAKASRRG